MKLRNIAIIALGTALILSVPLVAMQFTEEVQWDLRDFTVIGFLLMSAGLLYELISSKLNPKYRIVVAAVIAAIVFLVWAELAVGVFGSPFAGS